MKRIKSNIYNMSETQTPAMGQDAIAPVEPREAQSVDWDAEHKALQELMLGEKGLEIMTDVAEFADFIRSHIPNYSEYRAYHVLSPNTLPSPASHLKEEDLPKEYGVKQFVLRMREKYGSSLK